MTDWTLRQHEIVRENAYLGAAAIQQELMHECGIWRSLPSIEMKASRLRISLKVQTICPQCGEFVPRLNKHTGLCRKCTTFQHVEEQKIYNESLRAEAIKSKEEAVTAEREYARLRQANSRLRRKADGHSKG